MTDKFIGIQLNSQSVFHEGPEHMLDLMQETAGVNALLAYSHNLASGSGQSKRSLATLAEDHGVPMEEMETRRFPPVWFEQHPDKYYAATFLRFERNPDTQAYADRDVFAELLEPCRKRGVKLYARLLEGFSSAMAATVDNWPKVLAVDVYGRPTAMPCYNHPDYRNWWISMVEDLFKTHPLHGFMYGAERSGPLSNLLHGAYHGVEVPICFCEHCRARGRAKGIDVERARQGFQVLYEFINSLLEGETAPADGVLVTVLRTLLRYPEILAWEYLWHESKQDLPRLMYGAIKAIEPQAQVGWHLYHNGTTWIPLHRAEMDYAELVHYSDWIKPVVYHDVAGPRIHRDVGHLHDRVLRDLSKPQILDLVYAVMGYDKNREPTLEELPARGLSSDYVYRETRRAVLGVGGKVPIYAGVGFDIPWGEETFPSPAEGVYDATMKAFEAGAKGLIISREYWEMRVPNLWAVGRAIRDADAAGL